MGLGIGTSVKLILKGSKGKKVTVNLKNVPEGISAQDLRDHVTQHYLDVIQNKSGFTLLDPEPAAKGSAEPSMRGFLDTTERQQAWGADPEDWFSGSTHDITRFDASNSSPGNDWGPGTYASNTIEDVNANYAGVGPDLTIRIADTKDRFIDQLHEDSYERELLMEEYGFTKADYDDDPNTVVEEIAEKEARKAMIGKAGEGVVYPLKLRTGTGKYARIGGDDATVLHGKDFYEQAKADVDRADYDDEDEWLDAVNEREWELKNEDPESLLVRVNDALRSSDIGDDDEFIGAIMESIQDQMDDGSLNMTDLDDAIRKNYQFGQDAEGNMLSGGAISAQVLQNLGYEGVIDATVPAKFGPSRQYGTGMAGMTEDTKHAITFPGAERNIRSRFAMFDPEKWNSKDITAGVAAPILGGLLATESEDADAGTLSMANRISTRFPKSVRPAENPFTENLIIDTDAMRAGPGAFKNNMRIMAQYPQLSTPSINPDKRADHFTGVIADNLVDMYDRIPAQTRDISKRWYDGANRVANQFAEQYKQPPEAVSAVMAALSPQKDWYMNASLAERVLDINANPGTFTPEMADTATRIFSKEEFAPDVQAVATKPYEELSARQKAMYIRLKDEAHNERGYRILDPDGNILDYVKSGKGENSKAAWGSLNEISKAVRVLEDPSIENISQQMGGMHKVRNFFNNINVPNDPYGDTTIDTHAIGAGLLAPVSGNSIPVTHNFGGVGSSTYAETGAMGTYGLHADAYRKAADRIGVLPRELQSITWEGVRGLFPKAFKNATNEREIGKIWDSYKRGELPIDQARQLVYDYAGGINPPDWAAGRSAGPNARTARSTYKAELPESGLPGLVSPGMDSGVGGIPARGNPQSGNANPTLLGLTAAGAAGGMMVTAEDADASFIGRAARTWPHDMEGMALKMKDAGLSRDEIWKKTGVDLDAPGGLPRSELDDSGASIDLLDDVGNYDMVPRGEIGGILAHENLFAAYPDMARIRSNQWSGDNAEYTPNDGFGNERIHFGDLSGALHETQHAIQGREGFPAGGRPEEFLSDPVVLPQTELQSLLKKHNVDNLVDYTEPPVDTLSVARRLLEASGASAEDMARFKEIEAATLADKKSSYDKYSELAGEAEARNVQTRINMSPEDRRAIPPWHTVDIPENKQTIRHRAAMTAGTLGATSGMALGADQESVPEFEQRLQQQDFPRINNPDGSISTHEMAAEVDDQGNWFAFPTIQPGPDGTLQRMELREAQARAMAEGNYKAFGQDKQAALDYAAGGYKAGTVIDEEPLQHFGEINITGGDPVEPSMDSLRRGPPQARTMNDLRRPPATGGFNDVHNAGELIARSLGGMALGGLQGLATLTSNLWDGREFDDALGRAVSDIDRITQWAIGNDSILNGGENYTEGAMRAFDKVGTAARGTFGNDLVDMYLQGLIPVADAAESRIRGAGYPRTGAAVGAGIQSAEMFLPIP